MLGGQVPDVVAGLAAGGAVVPPWIVEWLPVLGPSGPGGGAVHLGVGWGVGGYYPGSLWQGLASPMILLWMGVLLLQSCYLQLVDLGAGWPGLGPAQPDPGRPCSPPRFPGRVGRPPIV